MFTHLHVHTDYSLLDGLGKVDSYARRAKELGMESLAFTDHGTMAGLVAAYDACKAYGIKFIGGFEAYVAPDGASRADKKTEKGEKPYNHLIILFKDEEGYKNGCLLVTRSHTEGYYYKPRIDFELLKEHSKGLIVLSACVAGAVPQAIIAGDMDKARRLVMQYKEVFGDDYYLEIQDHGLADERAAITGLLRLSRECGVKLVATNDCHYVRREDKEAHDWLLCMQTGRKVGDPDRMRYDGMYHLSSEEEMRGLFAYCPQAIDNTREIADKCNFAFTYGEYRMPKVEIPETYGNDFFCCLEDLAWEGFEKRYPEGHTKRAEATERLKYELEVVKQMGFAEYFLDIRKTIARAKGRGVLVGPGRGSGVGSCMNYCLEITDLEPLQYGLLFERFLNPERISMPDIDTDFEFLRREDIIRWEAEDYGKDCFAKIRAFQTMAAKEVLKSSARVSGIADQVAVGAKLAQFIPDKHTLQQAWETDPDLQAYILSDPQIQKIWDIARKLEGTKKSAGVHACGHIPTPVPCEQLFPCAVDPETGYLVCEYDMGQAEHLGNLKKDLLMLRNLTVIDTARDEIRKRSGQEIPLWTQEILNDKEALAMIARGDTDGVFQMESDGMKSFMRQLKPSCFEDIIAGVALYRPGPMDFIPDYVRNKHDPKKIRYLTNELEPILESTYGIIVYQEQVMQIVQKLAGFSMGRADLVRKAMGKKKQEIMDAEAPHFIDGDEELGIAGCANRGIPHRAAEKIWGQMVDFAKYAFNKSHAAAYAAISMQTAYLKAHYPHEFAVGLLTSVMDKTDKLSLYINTFRQMGIKILPPDVTWSEYGFTIEDGDKIRFGLSAIKGVGEDVARQIPSERENKPYADLKDFISRHTGFSKTALVNMAKAGAFTAFGYNRRTVAEGIADLRQSIQKDLKKRDTNQLTLFDLGFTDVRTNREIPRLDEYDFLEQCRMEKEATGIYLSGHPATSIMGRIMENGGNEIIHIVQNARPKAPVALGGIVTEVEKKYTKRGSQMMLITIEDVTGAMKVLAFEKTRRYWPHIHENGMVFITGMLKDDGDEPCVFMDSFCSMSDKPGKQLWLGTDSASLVNLEKQAKELVRDFPGIDDTLIIASKATRERKAIGKIFITDELVDRAVCMLGACYVAIKK